MSERVTTIEVERESEVVAREADSIFRGIVTEAVNARGDHGIPHKDVRVWTSDSDLTKLRAGREFFSKHLMSCGFALATAAFVALTVSRILVTFTRNSDFKSVKAIALMGVSLFSHMSAWFREGIESFGSKPARVVYKIRKVHLLYADKLIKKPNAVFPPDESRLRVLNAIHADLAHIPTPEYLSEIMTSTPPVLISQFDLVMLGSGLYTVFDINPTLVGLDAKAAAEGLDAYAYHLGVTMKYMGLEDRFNHSLHPNRAVRQAVSRRIWMEVILPCVKNIREEEFNILCTLVPHLKIIDPVALSVYGIIKLVTGASSGSNLHARLGRTEKIILKFLVLMFRCLRFSIFRTIANAIFKLTFLSGVAIANRIHGYRGVDGVVKKH